MLRRISQFFKDLSETIKRERGKLKISSDPVDFEMTTYSLNTAGDTVRISESDALYKLFIPLDIKDNIPEVKIKGQKDSSHLPRISSVSIAFPFFLSNMIDDITLKPVQDCDCQFQKVLACKELGVDGFLHIDLEKVFFNTEDFSEAKIKETVGLSSFKLDTHSEQFQVYQIAVMNGSMKINTIINDLETEYEQRQSLAFHYENSTVFNIQLKKPDLNPDIKLDDSLGCVMKFPIKRIRVSKIGYEKEELKRALQFIVERYKSTGRLSIVGIYKNVPVDTAERLTFSKNNELYFYLKKVSSSRSVLMDVLVVKTKEGRYHVGPIIRKA